jgi:hypothetical protein
VLAVSRLRLLVAGSREFAALLCAYPLVAERIQAALPGGTAPVAQAAG